MSRTRHPRPARRAAVAPVRPTPPQTRRQVLARTAAQLAHRLAMAAAIMANAEPADADEVRQRVKAYADELRQVLDAEERAAQDELHEPLPGMEAITP